MLIQTNELTGSARVIAGKVQIVVTVDDASHWSTEVYRDGTLLTARINLAFDKEFDRLNSDFFRCIRLGLDAPAAESQER